MNEQGLANTHTSALTTHNSAENHIQKHSPIEVLRNNLISSHLPILSSRKPDLLEIPKILYGSAKTVLVHWHLFNICLRMRLSHRRRWWYRRGRWRVGRLFCRLRGRYRVFHGYLNKKMSRNKRWCAGRHGMRSVGKIRCGGKPFITSRARLCRVMRRTRQVVAKSPRSPRICLVGATATQHPGQAPHCGVAPSFVPTYGGQERPASNRSRNKGLSGRGPRGLLSCAWHGL